LHNTKIGDARFRIGDYRAVAVIDEKKHFIAIAAVGHRREIYR
jgi:mRNA interferase RelE/StbE